MDDDNTPTNDDARSGEGRPTNDDAPRGRVIHPRLPEDVYDALAAYARAHDRSVQNAVVHLLRRALADEDPT